MNTETIKKHPHHEAKIRSDRLARMALVSFLLAFLVSRAVVLLIMAHKVPNMFLFVGDNHVHVHHLNYGIFLLAAVGGCSVFGRPKGRASEWVAVIYGFALALTFDEFGMWLHLGGSYWQRTSVDGVIIVAALIGLVAYARSLERFESHHRWAFIALIITLIGFSTVVYTAGLHLGNLMAPTLRDLEISSSP